MTDFKVTLVVCMVLLVLLPWAACELERRREAAKRRRAQAIPCTVILRCVGQTVLRHVSNYHDLRRLAWFQQARSRGTVVRVFYGTLRETFVAPYC